MISNKTNDISNLDYSSGQALLFDKPLNWTSFQVVNKVRRTIKVKKVGHAGTLDPLATGLLILCTGKKTKEIDKYQALYKIYSGTITLGKRSPSMDLGSEVTEIEFPTDLNQEKIKEVRDTFLGKIKQLPPMFSALKHKGKPLYKLARKGKEVEREPREVLIEQFDLTKIDLPDIHFKIKCSKGTYIRAIANDFGIKLGTAGILSSLKREAIGEFSVDDAFNLEEFVKQFEMDPVDEKLS